MICLRKITFSDAAVLSEKSSMPMNDALKMIEQSNAASCNNRYFEMYAATTGEGIVGLISLYEFSPSVVSIGPEIYEEFRQRGYAAEAMTSAMEIARSRGYRIVCQQIRTDNIASIRLHTRLGFETDNAIYRNKKQHEVSFFLKCL